MRTVAWGLLWLVLLLGRAQAGEPADFTPELEVLLRVVACAGEAPPPARFDRREVEMHCRALAQAEDEFRQRWQARAARFFAQLVPRELPPAVVYPFGGGDLVSALVVFPMAREYTTLSLEPAGDPRALERLPRERLGEALAELRGRVVHLFRVAHSKTVDMRRLWRGGLPGELAFALVGLQVTGHRPIALRYFRLEPDGTPRYLERAEAEDEREPVKRRFANLELTFEAPDGQRKVFRHIAANLDDAHLAADAAPLRHLEAKGEVAAMTKAASYLLWWKSFSRVRGYLVAHAVWMVSDSTGIPPPLVAGAGVEQIPYGRFAGPFLPQEARMSEAMVRLWREHPYRALPMRFGYPDSAGQAHLLVTRRAAPR